MADGQGRAVSVRSVNCPSCGAATAVRTFGHAVNVTLGLPFVRTSPDHGTAFDIAGKHVADHRNLLEAVRVAADVARGGKATQRRGLAAAFGRAA